MLKLTGGFKATNRLLPNLIEDVFKMRNASNLGKISPSSCTRFGYITAHENPARLERFKPDFIESFKLAVPVKVDIFLENKTYLS